MQLLKIINKSSIDKNDIMNSRGIRENKIFGTETEKIVILNINNSDILSDKIFSY